MARRTENDLFDLLERDHHKVQDLLEKLEATTPRAVKSRTELFEKLEQAVNLHAFIEEQIFYPRFEDVKEAREITLEAYEEHMIVRRLLSEMADLSPDDDVWTAKLVLLKELVEQHVAEEEGELFPIVEQVCTPDELTELGQQFQDLAAKGLPSGGPVLRGVERVSKAARRFGEKAPGRPKESPGRA